MMEGELVRETIIDLCNRSFLIISDNGYEKKIMCQTSEQFLGVMEVVNDLLEPERIKYANLAIYEKDKGTKN